MNEKLILALDVDIMSRAAALVDRLKDRVGFFKIGKQLFTAEGPAVVKMVRKAGADVFLDLKFHDIPNTVAAASAEAVKLGARMLNVHALGGYEMMARTADAVNTAAESLNIKKPLLIAVTILTSMDEKALADVGINGPLTDEVKSLSLLAKKAGLDGVVASPHEISLVKDVCGDDFVVVTPGVRPSFAPGDDQKRIMTPREAIKAGADYLVIGRPITKAQNPEHAADMIIEDMCQD